MLCIEQIGQPSLSTEERYKEIKIRKKQIVMEDRRKAYQLSEDECTAKEEKISGIQATIKDNTLLS